MLPVAATLQHAYIAQYGNAPTPLPRRSPACVVDGGGCAGFQYRFGLENAPAAGDTLVETDGVTMLVDADSLPFVAGAEVDYVEKIGAAAFEVRNPNAASGCGCGSSFSV